MGESRDLYDGWHARVADQAALDTPWHRLVRESLSIERDLDGRRVLEIACGRGDFAEWCAAHGRPLVFAAADFSMTAVRLARARVLTSAQAARVSFVQADARFAGMSLSMPRNGPPRTTIVFSKSCTRQPMACKTFAKRTSPCRLLLPNSGIVTSPPLIAARAIQ